MPNEISLTWDQGELNRWRGRALEQAVNRTLRKAGRDGLRALKAAAARSVRFRKRIKLGKVNDSLPTETSGLTNIDTMEWRMDVSGAPIPVGYYPHTQTRRGVMVAINAGRRVLIKSAFVALLKSGHESVFLRRTKASHPIVQALTTRVSDVFADNGMVPAVQAQAMKTFSATFDRVLPLEIDKALK